MFLLTGILRGRRSAGTVATLPSIAVIVAGRNESETLSRCLQSILSLDYPPELIERFYVDDGSTDDAWEIASAIARESEGRLTILLAPPNTDNLGPKKNALRAAIAKTQAELLLFTDADAQVPSGWAKTITGQFHPEVGAVAGLFDPGKQPTTPLRLYRLERLMHGIISAGSIGWGSPSSVCGANFAYRRECYEQLGGFSNAQMKAGDDDLMVQAIHRKGWKVRFATSTDTVVRDLRTPALGEFTKAKVRHQSTAREYPRGWLMFFWSILAAQIGYLAGGIWALFHPGFWLVFAGAVALRFACDYSVLWRFARVNQLLEWRKGFVLAELILPFYLLMQPIFALSGSFEWKQRRLTVQAAEQTKIP